MIDEAHERMLNTDVLMGLLKEVLQKRKGRNFNLDLSKAHLLY